jgi:hypothetical protein
MTDMTSTGKHGANTWDTEKTKLHFEDVDPDDQRFTTKHELRRTAEGRKYLVKTGVSLKGYRRGGTKEYSDIPFTERRFVSWDGEGDPSKTTYYLFGNSDGDYVAAPSLTTIQCLTLLCQKADKDAIHFGFAFGYDVNMILVDLSKNHLRILKDHGSVIWKRWRIEYIPRKWFLVTDRATNKTVRVWDTWSFFMTSAVKAWKQYGVEITEKLVAEKDTRSERGYAELEADLEYWREENQAYVQLLEKLRESLHAAGLYISSWHGPGAIASYSMGKHRIDKCMAPSPEPVNLASQYAYGGGRFELFKIGRANRPVYEYDINSAYPYAISQLPNLARGHWKHVRSVSRIARFGVYRVTFAINPFDPISNFHRPMPFFHRDSKGQISFPCVNDTWVWSPELWSKQNFPGITIHEGWEFVEENINDRPFQWLAENYEIRKEYKRQANPAQMALKLQMNSMYGKQAQRVGWNEEKRKPPKWHQLEWAGWVTSYCRSMVYRAALHAGTALVAFETDAVFSTVSLRESKYVHLTGNLGGWEETVYDDFVYLQSGARFGLIDGEWKSKYRGFDQGSLKLEDALYVLSLDPEYWTIRGTTKRFVGFAQALHQNFALWRTFETDKARFLHIGGEGKRRHIPKLCRACQTGTPASETFHDAALAQPIGGDSVKHYLPWKDEQLLLTQEQSDERKHEVIVNA